MSKYFGKLLFLLLIVASVVAAQGLDDNNDAKKLYNDGISLIKTGNFSGAYAKFDEALKLVDDYRLHYRKGDAKRKQKKFEEAIPNYEEAIKRNPDYYPSYYYAASSYFALKNYPLAKEWFEKTLQKTDNKKVIKSVNKNIETCNEKIAYPILVQGNSDRDAKKYQSAIDNFTKVLEAYQSDAAYIGLAECYVATGEFDKAIEAANSALKYRDKVSKGAVYYYIGLAYKGKGEKDKAKENFTLGKKYSDYKQVCEYELKLMS